MFIIKDSLESGKDVQVVDKSQMFKVLKWDTGYQLVCSLEGDAGVIPKRDVLWSGGKLTLTINEGTRTYSGDGNVFMKTENNPICLVNLHDLGGTIIVAEKCILAVPEEYVVSDPTEEGLIAVSGSGVLPISVSCELSELISVTVGGEDSLEVPAGKLVCWSSGMTRETFSENEAATCRFTGNGTVMFYGGH